MRWITGTIAAHDPGPAIPLFGRTYAGRPSAIGFGVSVPVQVHRAHRTSATGVVRQILRQCEAPAPVRAPKPSDLARGTNSDSFASLRALLRPPHRRRAPIRATGRWGPFRAEDPQDAEPREAPDPAFAARALLRRYGVIFRAVLERERHPVPWRDLARACRSMELRGEIRGGRFVAGFSGEQFAEVAAIPLLRKIRKRDVHPDVKVAAADPLNLRGVLTPDERVPSSSLRSVPLV